MKRKYQEGFFPAALCLNLRFGSGEFPAKEMSDFKAIYDDKEEKRQY